MHALYPLRFKEILRNYEFGGRWIAEAFAKDGLPADHTLAETWEVCDRPGESSITGNGPLAGRTLHQLIDDYGERLLGRDVMAARGSRFPLLVKLLDATNPLGEQVHPDDSLAREMHRDDTGKTEAWYMLRTRSSATIHCGTRDGMDRHAVMRALIDGTIRDAMVEQPAQPGDAFLLHAGTMHYSRGGVLFYEIMQNSDITLSLRGRDFPAGTDKRSEWAEKTLRAVELVPAADCRIKSVKMEAGTNSRSFIFACRYFALERLDLSSPLMLACDGEKFFVLTQVEGSSAITCAGGRETLAAGQTCLLPASLGEVRIEPYDPGALLKTYVPDLLRDIVLPLRAAGVADSDIVGLGGYASRNALIDLTRGR